MKDISIEQFGASVSDTLASVLCEGDIYRITTDKGNVVIMEEAEYKIMRDALKLAIAQSGR